MPGVGATAAGLSLPHKSLAVKFIREAIWVAG